MLSYFGYGGQNQTSQSQSSIPVTPVTYDEVGLGQKGSSYQNSFPDADKDKSAISEQTFSFGTQKISHKYVFLSRRYVYAMVTPKPVTQGHVLICPTRSVKQLSDLTELEVLELFVTAKEVASKFEEKYKVKNYMFLV